MQCYVLEIGLWTSFTFLFKKAVAFLLKLELINLKLN